MYLHVKWRCSDVLQLWWHICSSMKKTYSPPSPPTITLHLTLAAPAFVDATNLLWQCWEENPFSTSSKTWQHAAGEVKAADVSQMFKSTKGSASLWLRGLGSERILQCVSANNSKVTRANRYATGTCDTRQGAAQERDDLCWINGEFCLSLCPTHLTATLRLQDK